MACTGGGCGIAGQKNPQSTKAIAAATRRCYLYSNRHIGGKTACWLYDSHTRAIALDDARLIFANRLRAARLAAGLTQEALGVATGIVAEVARTRINRYERGVNECDLRTAKKLAEVLGMPLAALYADTDEIAEVIVTFAKLTRAEQRTVVNELKARAKKR